MVGFTGVDKITGADWVCWCGERSKTLSDALGPGGEPSMSSLFEQKNVRFRSGLFLNRSCAAAGTVFVHCQGRPSPPANGQNRQRGLTLGSGSRGFITHHSRDGAQPGWEAAQLTSPVWCAGRSCN